MEGNAQEYATGLERMPPGPESSVACKARLSGGFLVPALPCSWQRQPAATSQRSLYALLCKSARKATTSTALPAEASDSPCLDGSLQKELLE